MKKVLTTAGAIALLGLGAVTVNNFNQDAHADKLNIVSMDGSFSIDIDNVQEQVNFADYTFVGKVIEEANVEYIDEGQVNPDTGELLSTPITHYKVEVIDALSSGFPVGEMVDVERVGGLSEDKSSMVQFEGEGNLESDSLYTMSVGVDEENQLILSPKAALLIPTDAATQNTLAKNENIDPRIYTDTATYKSVKKAIKKAKPISRERYEYKF